MRLNPCGDFCQSIQRLIGILRDELLCQLLVGNGAGGLAGVSADQGVNIGLCGICGILGGLDVGVLGALGLIGVCQVKSVDGITHSLRHRTLGGGIAVELVNLTLGSGHTAGQGFQSSVGGDTVGLLVHIRLDGGEGPIFSSPTLAAIWESTSEAVVKVVVLVKVSLRVAGS